MFPGKVRFESSSPSHKNYGRVLYCTNPLFMKMPTKTEDGGVDAVRWVLKTFLSLTDSKMNEPINQSIIDEQNSKKGKRESQPAAVTRNGRAK